jgi:hypothetical protein
LLFSQTKLEIETLLILLGDYLVVRNDSWLSVLIVVVVHLAVYFISVWYSWIFSSFLKFSSQDHCLEHSNHKRLPCAFAVVFGAVEFVSSCSNSIIVLAVLSSSNAVSNSCIFWQQNALKVTIYFC